MAQNQELVQYRKPMRGNEFLQAMERIMLWAVLCAASSRTI
ncbi:hypothetical protein [Noviherbaspirillum sp. Root189]|nr:hypothetical protein [Noviherbaspirillum sp. Root189]